MSGGSVSARRAAAALAVLLALGGGLSWAQPARAPAGVSASPGASRSGVHEGAPYKIEMPAGWNGGLVMFAHGWQHEGPGAGDVWAAPLGAHLMDQGHAWAASGYRSRDYRPDWFMADTLALRERFIREFGRPRWTLIHGRAMGGHVAIASLELHPGVYQGALVECGAVDGIGLVDYLFAYTAAAEYISGVRLLDAPDRSAFSLLVNARWLPLVGPPDALTARGRQFASVVKHLMGGDLPLWAEGMRNRYLPNLVHRPPAIDAAVAPHLAAGSTLHIRYRIDPGLDLTEQELNAGVRRIAPLPGARDRAANPVYADLTGRLTAPVLTIHETGDARVPFRLQQEYRRKAIAAGAADLLVQRAVRWPGGCTFDSVVSEQAFDDLVRWVEAGTRPAGDDVLTADLAGIGVRWTPVRHAADRPSR